MNYYNLSSFYNLKEEFPNIDFIFFDDIDSTNTYSKTLDINKDKDLTIVLSNNQSSGRGSKGRSWSCPKGKGLLFSIVLNPKFNMDKLGFISILTPVALYETFKDLGIESQIKWPNDIYVNGKKLCGILTECTTLNNSINKLIIGIGINVNTAVDDFNSEIQNTSTSLKIFANKSFDRSIVLSTFINNFLKLYNDFINDNTIDIMKKYKSNSLVLNKKVTLIHNKTSKTVYVLDILDNGSLLTKDSNNNNKIINSGEISLRFL